jgi:hypothetical protein
MLHLCIFLLHNFRFYRHITAIKSQSNSKIYEKYFLNNFLFCSCNFVIGEIYYCKQRLYIHKENAKNGNKKR